MPRRNKVLKVGDQAPDFALRDAVSGQTVKLSELCGSVVVLNFDRGTYCGTCRPFQRSMRETSGRFKEAGARLFSIFGESRVLGVLHLNAPQAVKRFAEREQLPFPVLVDAECATGKKYGVHVVLNYETVANARPATFIIDSEGIIRFIHVSSRQGDRMRPAEILAEVERIQVATETAESR